MPAASVAGASNVSGPSASVLYACGDVHAVNVPPSIRQANVEPASDEENVNEAVVLFTGVDGPPVIVVSGAVASTVHAREAAVWSTLPAASVARTSKVCGPSASALYACGDVHAVNVPPSMRHANVEPTSVAENVNDAVRVVTVPAGPPMIDVSGADASIVHARDAAV